MLPALPATGAAVVVWLGLGPVWFGLAVFPVWVGVPVMVKRPLFVVVTPLAVVTPEPADPASLLRDEAMELS